MNQTVSSDVRDITKCSADFNIIVLRSNSLHALNISYLIFNGVLLQLNCLFL